MKAIKSALTISLVVLLVPYSAFADCFLVTKSGNVRSGPSTEHEVVGHVEKWQVFNLASSSYVTKWEGDWLCIMKPTWVEDKTMIKVGGTVWDEETELNQNYRIGQEVEVVNVSGDNKVLGTEKGLMIRFTGNEKMGNTFIQKEIEHHPLGRTRMEVKEYIHKSLGKVIPGSYGDATRRVDAIRTNDNWPPSVKETVLTGQIALGMNQAQVRASWGTPHDVNRTGGRWGIHEQWVYGDVFFYFENDKLTACQD